MALDIVVYRGLSPLEGDIEPGDEHWCPGPAMAWSETVWPGRAAPLDPDQYYRYKARWDFRAGSYSLYGTWRRQLSTIAQSFDRRAFTELINFADNEGVIGTIAAVGLAEDFADCADIARTAGPWFFDLYTLWRRACVMASDAGAIEFT